MTSFGILAAAWRKAIDFDGVAATKIFPPAASRSSAFAPRRGAATANSFVRASWAARRTAGAGQVAEFLAPQPTPFRPRVSAPLAGTAPGRRPRFLGHH